MAKKSKYLFDQIEAILDGTKSVIYVAANDATANEKAKATYVCDGVNDEVQWALANTAANGGEVILLGTTFNIQATITLTSHFKGSGAKGNSAGTYIIVDNPYQIIIHSPGNLTNASIYAKTRTDNTTACVLIEAIESSLSYDSKIGLLDKLVITGETLNVGIGLQIYTNSSANMRYFAFCTFGEIVVKQFKTDVLILAEESGSGMSFINSNNFGNITLTNAETMIELKTIGTAEVVSNSFVGIHMQHQTNTLIGVYLNGITNYNMFPSIDAMDWVSPKPSVKINGSTISGCLFQGRIPYVDYGGRASTNTFINLLEPVQYKNGGTLTIASGVITATGQGEYLVAVESGTAGSINTISGIAIGQKIILRTAVAGHTINLTTNVGIPKNISLYNTSDFVELISLTNGLFKVVAFSQGQGSQLLTRKLVIGTPTSTGTDVNFTGAANQNNQGKFYNSAAAYLFPLPTKSRIIAVEIVCTQTVVSSAGAVSISLTAGEEGSASIYIASGACTTLNDVLDITDATLPALKKMNASATVKFGISGTPTQNWDTITAGKWDIYVTYISYN